MIRHTVVFSLKYAQGSQEEKDFFKAAALLASIPGVEKFENLKQVSRKNKYEFGLSMEFATQQIYEAYNGNLLHTRFIEEYWLKAVTDFMEIDYEKLND